MATVSDSIRIADARRADRKAPAGAVLENRDAFLAQSPNRAAQKLRRFRNGTGGAGCARISQSELAARFGVARLQVTRWESSQSRPSAAIMAAMRDAGICDPNDWYLPPEEAYEQADATIEEERLYRKQRLAVSFRLFARLGFELGASGHITARDPEWPDRFWVNPVMHPFGEMRVSDLLLVAHDGSIIEGEGVVNPAGFAIHSQLHAIRPDVVAAAHSHSVYGKTWSAFGRLIEPLTQDSAIFYEDLAIFDRFSGMVEDLDEGQRIGKALGSKSSIILQNHGILTTGACVESAVWRYVALENACHVQLLAEAAGGGAPMPADVARHTHGQLGSDMVGVYSFEPYWRSIIAREPEVLD